jgi:hypothetical protein
VLYLRDLEWRIKKIRGIRSCRVQAEINGYGWVLFMMLKSAHICFAGPRFVWGYFVEEAWEMTPNFLSHFPVNLGGLLSTVLERIFRWWPLGLLSSLSDTLGLSCVDCSGIFGESLVWGYKRIYPRMAAEHMEVR